MMAIVLMEKGISLVNSFEYPIRFIDNESNCRNYLNMGSLFAINVFFIVLGFIRISF